MYAIIDINRPFVNQAHMCIHANIVHKDHATNQAHKDCKIDEANSYKIRSDHMSFSKMRSYHI